MKTTMYKEYFENQTMISKVKKCDKIKIIFLPQALIMSANLKNLHTCFLKLDISHFTLPSQIEHHYVSKCVVLFN